MADNKEIVAHLHDHVSHLDLTAHLQAGIAPRQAPSCQCPQMQVQQMGAHELEMQGHQLPHSLKVLKIYVNSNFGKTHSSCSR